MTVLDDLRGGYKSPDGKFELHHKDDVAWFSRSLAGFATPYVSFWLDWRLHRTRKYYE